MSYQVKGNNLSYEDPFDNIPDENVKEVPQVEEIVVEPQEGGDGTEFSLTFKGRGTHQNRWLVVRFPDAVTGLRVIKDPAFKELIDYSRKIEEYDSGAYAPQQPAQAGVAPQSGGGAPPASQEAPGGEKRFCSHGEMVFKSGVSKAGNAYRLFSCTAPREQQCKAQYLK
jgi:hypothetical protein